MAEVEQANTQSAISPQTAPSLESHYNSVPLTDNSARLVDHQSISASDTAQQVPERVLPEQSVPESSDDEVEFVFSVPRRRKKRHRRLELPSQHTHTSSPISSAGVVGARPSPEKLVADMAPLHDHCTEPDEMNRVRCHSVNPINKTPIFDTFLQPLDDPQSELPVKSPADISQTIPFKIPPPWYAKSILPSPSPTSPFYYAKSATFTTPEQDHGKKRKHQDSSEALNHVSPYMSSASMCLPRPKLLPCNSNNSPIYGHTGFVDFLEDPNVPTTFGGVPLPLPPHRPVIPGWQDFSWKPVDYSPPQRAPSIEPRVRMFSNVNNDPNWHRKYYFGAVDPNCANSQPIPNEHSPSERYAQEMVSPKTIPLNTQNAPASYLSIQTKLVPESRHMPTEMSASSTNICPPSSVMSSNSATYSQPTHPVTLIRHTCPSPLPRPQVTAADIRRKPSLYRIPAWPHSIDNKKAFSTTALSERQNQTRDTESNEILSAYTSPPQQARPTASHIQDSISSPPQTQVAHSSRPQTSTSASASSSKHSPNLIIDIAQTSQDTFPFAAVAARHNKPIQKVFDTFSAIIQLPLLKQAADGRRHGPLGSERMRMYREAKRAMERANRENEKGKK